MKQVHEMTCPYHVTVRGVHHTVVWVHLYIWMGTRWVWSTIHHLSILVSRTLNGDGTGLKMAIVWCTAVYGQSQYQGQWKNATIAFNDITAIDAQCRGALSWNPWKNGKGIWHWQCYHWILHVPCHSWVQMYGWWIGQVVGHQNWFDGRRLYRSYGLEGHQCRSWGRTSSKYLITPLKVNWSRAGMTEHFGGGGCQVSQSGKVIWGWTTWKEEWPLPRAKCIWNEGY